MIRPIRKPEPAIFAPPPRIRARPRPVRKAELLRLMDAVRAGGLTVASVEVKPDGTVRLSAAEVLGTPSDDFAKWEGRL